MEESMRKRKLFLMMGFILITVFAVTACSRKKMDTSTTYQYDSMENSAGYDYDKSEGSTDTNLAEEPVQTGAANASTVQAAPAESVGLTSTSSFTSNNSQLPSQNKIIQKYYLDVETQDFDNLITTIDSEIKSLSHSDLRQSIIKSGITHSVAYTNDNNNSYFSVDLLYQQINKKAIAILKTFHNKSCFSEL
jgi:hypothetical protein